MRLLLIVLTVVATACRGAAQPVPTPLDDPTPQTLDEFKAAAARVLDETGVPGAGLALVNVGGTEWAGGVGWADRDRQVPVTADTHFRAGSISKTFVALALVQLYEDGKLDLDASVASLVPEVAIDNPWQADTPVTVRHLLEHTAGFDDMHFNEAYVLDGAPDLPLEQVLQRNPASRRVRWQPGTRMSYSNPGYAVAGLVVEKVSGQSFDDYVEARIFRPLEMTTSSFRRAPSDDPALARGYAGRTGPPVIDRRIYLRPAGALVTSPAELAYLVQALLGWGERRRADGGEGYVVDPEYQSNMEWPRTTLASTAGVRSGYGLGIFSTITLPYHVLGHNGGIDGFLSAYGYSPSRDVGYVVLLNSTHSPAALTRLTSLAIRYLKREVEPSPEPTLAATRDELQQFAGYYRDTSPRNAILAGVQFLRDGRTIAVEGDRLVVAPDFGQSIPLVPVNLGLFRREREIDASLAFTTTGDGTRLLTGPGVYATLAPRWPIVLLRAGLLVAAVVGVMAPLVAVGRWFQRRRRNQGRGAFAGLGPIWLAAAATVSATYWVARDAGAIELGGVSWQSATVFAGTLAYPALVTLGVLGTLWGYRHAPRRWYAAWSGLVAVAHVAITAYLGWSGWLAFRSWLY
jgi:CubicO group peptidase (beta-lactamase class C family)